MPSKPLSTQLDALFKADPRLTPNPAMHDYQLTYPPAIQIEKPRFACTPTDAEFVEQAVGRHRNAAYYFHFGFCKYRCRYCFHYEIRANGDTDLMTRYVAAMCAEMRRVRSLAPQLRSLIYLLGGGTPTYLPSPLIEKFLDQLLNIFGPTPTELSTLEAKPITATTEKLLLFAQAGFRRINLGVQTLDPKLYELHHHGEPLTVALDAIERARKCGFDFINVDILTGIEGQTSESWGITLRTLELLVTQGAIDSVFIYPYHDDPRSKTFGKPGALPSQADLFESDERARELFTRLKWNELGTRFYRSPRHARKEVREWIKSRANPSYGALLYHGFGNSAFSVGDYASYLNHRGIDTYCEQVARGGLGTSHWTTLDDLQRATRDITFDLLYSPVVRVRQIGRKYGHANIAGHTRELERWTELGLGKWNKWLGIWRLTPLGKLVHQEMLPALYLPSDHREFVDVMHQRLVLGKSYRGY